MLGWYFFQSIQFIVNLGTNLIHVLLNQIILFLFYMFNGFVF